MFSWYKIWNFSLKNLPGPQIFALKHFSRVWSSRSTEGASALSCHLLGSHVLLIQRLTFQLERPSRSADIRAKTFFESLKYQEHRRSFSFLVPPRRTSRSPDTKSQISARWTFRFSSYVCLNIFWRCYIPRTQLAVWF